MINGEKDQGPVSVWRTLGVIVSDHTQDQGIVVRGLSPLAKVKKPNALTEWAMTKDGVEDTANAGMLDSPRTKPTMISKLDDRIVLDGISIRRMKDKRKCQTCFRGTHLLFSFGPFLHWRKCRRHLSKTESALLAQLLIEAFERKNEEGLGRELSS